MEEENLNIYNCKLYIENVYIYIVQTIFAEKFCILEPLLASILKKKKNNMHSNLEIPSTFTCGFSNVTRKDNHDLQAAGSLGHTTSSLTLGFVCFFWQFLASVAATGKKEQCSYKRFFWLQTEVA